MKQYILMADIIQSGSKEPVSLMKSFKAITKSANKFFKDVVSSPLTITLGDEFQGVIKTAKDACDIIVFLEEELIHRKLEFKLRYVLNQGAIDTSINSVRSYEMLGKGLTDARHFLGELKKVPNRFYFSVENPVINGLLKEAFTVFEAITAGWDEDKDYELVSYFIKHKDYKIIAELLNKDRSQIWKREKSLFMQPYNAVKNIIAIAVNIN